MKDLQGLSSLLLFAEDANAGKEEDEEENVHWGEEGEEEEEEEEEEETGRDDDPRLSLQFSELLPLNTFPVWAARGWRDTERHCDVLKINWSFFHVQQFTAAACTSVAGPFFHLSFCQR